MKKTTTLLAIILATIISFGSASANDANLMLNPAHPMHDNIKLQMNKSITYSISEQSAITPVNKLPNALQAGTEDISITWMSYENAGADEEQYGGLGLNQAAKFYALMIYEPEDLLHFKGVYSVKTINSINFAIAGLYVSYVKNVKAVILTLNGNSLSILATKDVPNPVGDWNNIALDIPFEVPANTTLYIGYYLETTGQSYPLSLTDEKGVPKQSRLFYGTSSLSILDISNNYGSFRIKADATAELSDIQYNANFTDLYVPDYVAKNSNFQFEVEVANYGTQTITSLELGYKVDDGAEQTFTKSGLNINAGNKATFASPNINAGDVVDVHSVDVTIKKINGSFDDEDLSNNNLSSNYSVAAFMPKKIVFGEEATGTWCQWCPRGWVMMENMKNTYPNDWIGVAVHNGDPMVVAAYDDAIMDIINGSGYPHGSVDRTYDLDPSQFEQAFNYAKDEFGLASLETSSYLWTSDTRKVSFDATATFAAKVKDGDLRFIGIITEDSCRGTSNSWRQVNAYSGGANGKCGGFEDLPNPVPASQMFYNDVARAVIGTPYGESGSIPANLEPNETATFNFSYTIPVTWNYDNLHFIVIIYDANNKIVYNAAKAFKPTGIYDTPSALNAVYPNPTKGDINLDLNENGKVTVFSLDGNVIYEGNSTEGVSNLKLNAPAGTYFIRIEAATGTTTSKFVIE
ncbi:MAG: T9SS type A sorting domain-containing protein [Ignavibacteria bacterium]|jgi:hypothetical protein|nr:T9SS type A sorting domain-containing protein [Ignavibacteria bacterium]